MTQTSFFQRYSQRENHVTNNTLLALRHIYRASPRKLQQIITSLTDDEKIAIGPRFNQQTRGSHSIPDGHIFQAPLAVYIEAKRGGAIEFQQIENHIKSIKDADDIGGPIILIGLTSHSNLGVDIDSLQVEAKKVGIRFVCITYRHLLESMRSVCAEYESDLLEVIDDYGEFLREESLLYDPKNLLVGVLAGDSKLENVQYGVFYDGAERPSRADCGFLGLYHDKHISHVGRIVTAVVCTLDDGVFKVHSTEGPEASDKDLTRVKDIIKNTSYYELGPYEHRYYIVDKFEPTNFFKHTPGPMRGLRYFDLTEIDTNLESCQRMSTRDIALALSGKSFE